MKKPIYKRWWFIALAVIIVLGGIGASMGGGDDPGTDTGTPTADSGDTNSDPAVTPDETVTADPVVETPSATMGEKNALNKAGTYLDTMAFSYTGLIAQLEYEGFTTAEATYGVDNCGADWNEQAALKAQQYLDTMSFSRQGLIDQLVYEGFTASQAAYGADAVGY